jgi:hypothetical protein
MPRTEEGVDLRDVVVETIDYLQDVLERLDTGREHEILADPYYVRPHGKAPYTDEQVDRVIAAIDSEFYTEISEQATYHRNRSGANATPDFWRLSQPARRAVVEGLEAIKTRHQKKAAAT